MAYAWLRDFRLRLFKALRELMIIAAFGLAIAYAAALVWGAPVLYALYRLGWLRAASVIVAGARGGTLIAVWFAFNQHGDSLIRVHMPLLGGAALGALVAGITWGAARRDLAECTGHLNSTLADRPRAPCHQSASWRPAAERDAGAIRCTSGDKHRQATGRLAEFRPGRR